MPLGCNAIGMDLEFALLHLGLRIWEASDRTTSFLCPMAEAATDPDVAWKQLWSRACPMTERKMCMSCVCS